MTPGQFKAHPEWKHMLDVLRPLILEGEQKQYTYDDLKELTGVEVEHSRRGRGQFYKFRRAALREFNIWFEVEPTLGYTILPASEQQQAAAKRVRWGKRKILMARDINAMVKFEELKPAELVKQAQMGALLQGLIKAHNHTGRQIKMMAQTFKIDMSVEELQQLATASTTKQTRTPTPRKLEMAPETLRILGGLKAS